VTDDEALDHARRRVRAGRADERRPVGGRLGPRSRRPVAVLPPRTPGAELDAGPAEPRARLPV